MTPSRATSESVVTASLRTQTFAQFCVPSPRWRRYSSNSQPTPRFFATAAGEERPHDDRRIPRQTTSERRGDMQGVIRANVDLVTRAAVTIPRIGSTLSAHVGGGQP